jgi:nucleoid-associated protein YgaU
MGAGDERRRSEQKLQQAGELSDTFPNNAWPQAVASIVSVSPSAGDGTYTVRPGDNLYDIAGSKLGDPNLWPEIQAANPQLVPAAGTPIHPGQVLRIPRLGKPADGGAS